MKGGDKNTAYFHARASTRNHINNIKGLQNTNGVLVRRKEEMEAVVDEYFRNLFRSSSPSEGDIEDVLHDLGTRLSEEDATFLSQPFTDQEVKDALFLYVSP